MFGSTGSEFLAESLVHCRPLVIKCFWSMFLIFTNLNPVTLCISFSFIADFRSLFLAVVMLLFSTIMAPVLYHLWIYAGSGNANFFYATTLAFNLAQVCFRSLSFVGSKEQKTTLCAPRMTEFRMWSNFCCFALHLIFRPCSHYSVFI